jgi:hypothetical protein
MKDKALAPKTDSPSSLSPYQVERPEAQQAPVVRPDPAVGVLAPLGSEATAQAHAAKLDESTAGPALRRLQRQYGNRYVQRVVERVQRQGGVEGFQLDDETAGRIHRARSGGQPLDGAVQAQMSGALGYDFSGVRVHTDSEADVLSQQLSAKAFTIGQDIFFRRGEYSPGPGPGRELIAHELTHVAQQCTGRVRSSMSGMTVRPAGDVYEQEADDMTGALSSADPMLSSPMESVGIERLSRLKEQHRSTPLSQEASGDGALQIQRAVLHTMAEDDWLAEMNFPLAERAAGGPRLPWGRAYGQRGDRVAVMGHGAPGRLLDARGGVITPLRGDHIANELQRGWENGGRGIREVILWSCHAGEPEGDGNPSLVDATAAALRQEGIHATVNGVVGLHVPDVRWEERYAGPRLADEDELELFTLIERHHRRNHGLATWQADQVVIRIHRHNQRSLIPGDPLHTYREVYEEWETRGRHPDRPFVDSQIDSFYRDLFDDPDIPELTSEVGNYGRLQVSEPRPAG